MKRTGGTWDADAPPCYFIPSGVGQMAKVVHAHDYILIAVNELRDDLSELEAVIKAKGHLLIDSGIFMFTNSYAREHGKSMDEVLAMSPDELPGFDELWDKYVRVTSKLGEKAWGYIELDQGGAVNKRRLRARLENLGLRPIPVYHPLVDGWEYFDELASQYDRICLGNMVQADPYTRKRLLATMWERKRRDYPKLWIHVLGLTPNELSLAYPMSSCDSSTWLAGVRWAGALHTRCACGNFSTMSREYYYDTDEESSSAKGAHRAWAFGAWDANQTMRNMRAHAADLEACLGFRWNGENVEDAP